MGNLAQIDTPYLTEGSSGMTFAVDRFKGEQSTRTQIWSDGCQRITKIQFKNGIGKDNYYFLALTIINVR